MTPSSPPSTSASQRVRRWLTLLTLWMVSSAAVAEAPATTIAGRPVAASELRIWLDAARQRHGVPGLALATIEGGEVRSVIVSGIADVDAGTPVTPETRFEAASLSKPVFSRAWMVAVDEGDVTLDAPLAAAGGDLGLGDDPRVAALTARQLLSHQGGLPNWRETPSGPLRFVAEPGSGLAYSGEGYDALARALARALKTDDAGLAAHLVRVTMPNGARSPFAFRLDHCQNGKAAPHRQGRRIDWTPCLDHVSAAGGLEASPADYALWMAEAMSGKGLSAQADAAWWRGQGVVIPEDHPSRAHGLVDWSLGFAIHAFPWGRMWVHTGDQPGYTALALIADDRKRGLVVMTNADAAHAFLLELVGFLATPVEAPATPEAAAFGAVATTVVEAARDADLILLGDIHGIADGQTLDLEVFKALHRGAQANTYIGEFDFAQAHQLQTFLDTGDRASLDAVFRGWQRSRLQWASEDHRRKWIAMREWNAQLPPSRRVRVLGGEPLQDPGLACEVLRQWIPDDARWAELRVVVRNSDNCRDADRLAAATPSRRPVPGEVPEPLASGLDALAQHREGADRTSRIVARVDALLESLRGTPAYGFWGVFHVIQTQVNRTTTAAHELARRGHRIASVVWLPLNAAMMVPDAGSPTSYTQIPYTLDDPATRKAKGIEDLVTRAQGRVAAFPWPAPGVPSDALTRVEGPLAAQQPFEIAPETAARDGWMQAVVITRGSAATTPIQH